MSEELISVERRIADIKTWPELAKQALDATEDTAQLVDVVGELHMAAWSIGNVKRRYQAELQHGDAGNNYRVVQGRKAIRSYNLMSLVKKFQERWGHRSALITMMQLIEDDVMRVSWQWKKLMQLASDFGVEISTVSERAVENGDPNFDIGTVWIDATMSFDHASEDE